ncbi:MAG: metal-dependent transcriptional regulator [Chloroflexi bacterium]|nr:metal-dependent transcriptional regulator [Chloroflexota bacterium]
MPCAKGSTAGTPVALCHNVRMTSERTTTKRAAGAGPRTRSMSRAGENYLLSLAILQEDGIAPHISQLAAYLRHIPEGEEVGTTLASVSGMIQRMAKEGLLEMTKEKQIVLTAAGEKRACDVVRRHRLSERLLVDVLDVPLESAEAEAHALEHAISPGLLERIEEKLGFPDTCPYGRPIYRDSEVVLRRDTPGTIPLSDANSNTAYVVTRIPDEDFPLLQYLVENQILPGQRISVEDVAGYRGVVDVARDGEKVSLGMDVASRIRVKLA